MSTPSPTTCARLPQRRLRTPGPTTTCRCCSPSAPPATPAPPAPCSIAHFSATTCARSRSTDHTAIGLLGTEVPPHPQAPPLTPCHVSLPTRHDLEGHDHEDVRHPRPRHPADPDRPAPAGAWSRRGARRGRARLRQRLRP